MDAALFHKLIEHSPEAILLLDGEGVIRFASAATATVFGDRPEEAVGHRLSRWLLPEDVPGFTTSFERCLDNPRQLYFVSGYYRQYEHRNSADPLDVLYGEGRLTNLLHDPAVNGVLLFFRELPADEGLRRDGTTQAVDDWGREHNLQVPVINVLPDQIFVKNRNGRLMTANDAALRARGCRAVRHLRGKTDRDFFPRDVALVMEAEELAVLLTGRPSLNQEQYMKGEGRWLSISRVPLRDPDGKVVGLVGICHDITHRKRAEEELRHAKAAAEAANRAKGDLLQNVSHECRTPLGIINNAIRLTLDSELTAEQHAQLLTMQSWAGRMLTLINDLLDFSKIEAGKVELECVPFSLRDCLDNTVRSMAPQAFEKGLRLDCQCDASVPDGLIGDAGRLGQIVLNLVGNAVKFTSSGEVLVRVRLASGGCQPPEWFAPLAAASPQGANAPRSPGMPLHFEVSDTGIGIPADKLQAIFQAFEQADSSMTRKYGGTGLGLAISSRLVELMGGRLEVESDLGRGSRFFFTLSLPLSPDPVPRSTSETASQDGRGEQPSQLPRAARPLHILLVEDNLDNQALTRDLLTRMGHRVTPASNGREALEVLAGAFDVVLTDVQMPELDGQEATQAIRRGEAGRRDIPIIGVSAHASASDRDACLAAGMDGYLPKPCPPEELFGAIERIVTRTPGPLPRQAPASDGETEVFIEAQALAQFGGQVGLMREQAIKFLDGHERDLATLRQAAGDAATLARAAHRYVSSLGCYFSAAVRQTARRVNELAKEGKAAEAAALIDHLEAQVKALAAALRRWLQRELPS